VEPIRFDILEQTGEQALLRLRDPTGAVLHSRTLSVPELERFVESVQADADRVLPDLSAIGRRLYQWLNGDEGWLDGLVKTRRELAVALPGDRGLSALPWELLAHNGTYLATNPDAPFTPVRRVHDKGQTLEPAPRPLRLLFMACSPMDTEPVLDYEGEEARILAATQGRKLELEVEESGSLGELRRRVEDAGKENGRAYFDVFHLSGHADVRTVEGEPIPGFHVEDDLGRREWATARDLATAFSNTFPSLLFLSGCRTGQSPQAGVLPSFCEALVAAGAPAVLGWALPVRDDYATAAAAALYRQLAVGKALDEAVALTRAHLFQNGCDQWHLLRLYTDATPPVPRVLPPKRQAPLKPRRPAAGAFLDARGGNRELEVCPRHLFVGRRRSIQRALRTLRTTPGEEGYAEGILIHGMGGLGKSSLAARLCERMDARRLVFWGQLDEAQFLARLGQQLDAPEALAVMNEGRLTLTQRLRHLVSEHLLQPPALFIFDDFEQNVRFDGDAPRRDGEGRAVLRDEVGSILKAVLQAIHDSGADSRVLVTCRYQFAVPLPLRLAAIQPPTLQGADEAKKYQRLMDQHATAATGDGALRRHARELAAGNPRLMEWLFQLLDQPGLDHGALLTALEAKAQEFREQTLLQLLLDAQEPACQSLLALVSVFDLPVDREAVVAVATDSGLDPSPLEGLDGHLARAAALGLVEGVPGSGTVEGTGAGARPFVSAVLAPLLAPLLTEAQWHGASGRGARDLYRRWWVEGSTDEAQALEIYRLAMAGGEGEIAAEIADGVSWNWNGRSRFREAELLCRSTLEHFEDYRPLNSLAYAEGILGKTEEAKRHYQRAMELCPPVEDSTPEAALKTRSSILYNLATLLAQQGDVKRALELWNESLQIYDRIGDVKGKAATLHQMAGVIAQQGDVKRALELWNESLQIKERIGDVKGKAATLANMAWASGQQGDRENQREFNQQAIQSLAAVHAWLDTCRVLGNLAASSEGDESRAFLAQALWLAFRVQTPFEDLLNPAAALIQGLGPESDTAARLAGATALLVLQRTQNHPQQEELQQQATSLLAFCAQAREIPGEELQAWIQRKGLLNPETVLPQAIQALEALIGDRWLFDRAFFQHPTDAP